MSLKIVTNLNQLKGTLSATQLPPIPAQDLTGTLSLGAIPDQVWLWGMQTNDLVGTIRLRNLPVASLTEIAMTGTLPTSNLAGTISLDNLPINSLYSITTSSLSYMAMA